MKRTAVVILTVVMATMLCGVAWGQGGGPKGPRPMSAAMVILPPPAAACDQISKVLSLTTDQTTALKTVMTAYDATLPALLKAAADASKALRDSVSATEYNAETVKGLADKAQAAETAVIDASIAAWGQIRTVLTADQVATLMAPPPPPPGGGGHGGGRPGGGRR